MHNPSAGSATAPATASAGDPSGHQKEYTNTSGPAPTNLNAPTLTRDFHLDTFFNPVWTAGPNTFSFNEKGIAVRPTTYASEPYPGYHADGDRLRGVESINASCSQGLVRRDVKPWKNVAITEQDEDEFAALQERMAAGAVGEFRQWYGHSQHGVPYGTGPESEYVYTWPPPPQGGDSK